MRHAWVSRVGMVTLVGGLCLVGSDLGITHVTAAPPVKDDALAGVTQNWDKVLPAAQRFTVLAAFNNEAVRDNETGLVWERSPATTAEPWFNTRGACAIKNVGGRIGWRLPSLPELSSLVDPSASPGLTLPVGHPFSNVQGEYWSGSTVLGTNAWEVSFFDGLVRSPLQTSLRRAWCVRGGMNTDAYRD
jgi:hypothetical protein